MADDGISTKVSVLGDKEYKKALQDIGRRLTVLNTEMSATTSAFGDQADSMEAMQAKARALQSVYQAHADKVNLIAEQLNKAKIEYDENSQQVQNLQIALNRARTAMNKVGSQIRENDKAMAQMAAQTGEATGEQLSAKVAVESFNKTLKMQESALQASQSAFGKQTDSLAGLRDKHEKLSAILETQQKNVKALRDELESAKAEYGENSGQVADWQTALNKATAEMNGTATSIRETEIAIDKMTDAVTQSSDEGAAYNLTLRDVEAAEREAAKAAEKAEDETTALADAMEGVGSVASGAMKAGLEAAAAAIAALSAAALAGAKEVLQLGTDYAQATGQLSAQTGATGEELAELGGIAQRVYTNNFGDNIEDVNSALATTKVNTGLMGDE